jgi:hypothetical protein
LVVRFSECGVPETMFGDVRGNPSDAFQAPKITTCAN